MIGGITKVLLAEDEVISRRMAEACLRRWGYEVVTAENGITAMRALADNPDIKLALVDWMMPELDGLGVCRNVRSMWPGRHLHIIQLTARTSKEDIVLALSAGADDYLSKPFDPAELRARIGVGERMILVRDLLAQKVVALETALSEVKRLQGLLPICMHCKKIRDQKRAWQSIEQYISEHSEAEFSHGICEDCLERCHPAQ